MQTFSRLATAALAAVLAVSLAPAPDAEAQDLARFYQVTPKDVGAFEAALKKHAQDRIAHDDPWSWSVMQVVVGEDYGDFIYRSGGHTWADFDEYDAGFGAQSGLHYQVNVAPLVADARTWISRVDTANSVMPADSVWPSIDYVEVITYHVEPTMMQQFNEAVSTIHGAIEESEWPVHYAWANPVSGAKGPTKVLAIFFENWAAFEEPETPMMEMLQDELGEDETEQIMQQFGNSFSAVESMVLRWRRDLSVPPPAMRGDGSDGGMQDGGGSSGSSSGG